MRGAVAPLSGPAPCLEANDPAVGSADLYETVESPPLSAAACEEPGPCDGPPGSLYEAPMAEVAGPLIVRELATHLGAVADA